MAFSGLAMSAGGLVEIPPRGLMAVAWLVSGINQKSEIAKKCGVHRNSLNRSDEFRLFREEWDKRYGCRENHTSNAPTGDSQ